MILYQEYFVPCCAGWHFSHQRARIGSYHDWLLRRILEMAL